MNATGALFDAGELIGQPRRRSASVKVKVSDDKVTGVGGVALWGPMLDNLNLVGVADGRRLRPIGPGGYTGGECYRALVEILLAGGDFLSDRSLLDGPTQQLRGAHVLPSHATMFRFEARCCSPTLRITPGFAAWSAVRSRREGGSMRPRIETLLAPILDEMADLGTLDVLEVFGAVFRQR
ncbi:hypothetical protein [Candidatus Neomicrothrix sp.]|uniref:hypothetical protein n=1 Tax=Candidatus Neomicrothrix sp. TaxID=2719034 RepID=UPI0025B94AB1|nr:hypothetical protein [Candidatus Microthrix sp.]